MRLCPGLCGVGRRLYPSLPQKPQRIVVWLVGLYLRRVFSLSLHICVFIHNSQGIGIQASYFPTSLIRSARTEMF